jgi:hypothetical protein
MATPEEIDITNAAELRAALLGAIRARARIAGGGHVRDAVL